ncbi:MAG: FxsA family protein [Euryarchaeota archaeon]|nr:FxsA family protein [Euryarchaeota archaeon]
MLGALLVLLFIVLPFIEIVLLVWIGGHIGFWPTVGIVIGTGILGGLLAKWQGGRAWREVVVAMQSGRVPGRELLAGALFLVGAAFLLTPGVITDTIGFLFMVPPVRRGLAAFLVSRLRHRAVVGVGRFGGGWRSGAPPEEEQRSGVTRIRRLEDEPSDDEPGPPKT